MYACWCIIFPLSFKEYLITHYTLLVVFVWMTSCYSICGFSVDCPCLYGFEILNQLTIWSQSWKVKCIPVHSPSDGIYDVEILLSCEIYLLCHYSCLYVVLIFYLRVWKRYRISFVTFVSCLSPMLNLCRSSDDGTCRIWDARGAQFAPRIYVPRPPSPDGDCFKFLVD